MFQFYIIQCGLLAGCVIINFVTSSVDFLISRECLQQFVTSLSLDALRQYEHFFANKLLLVLIIIIPEEFVIKNILNIAGSVESLNDLDHS